MSTVRALASAGSIGSRRGLGDQISASLRDLVVSGELAPGTHLVETELAEAFDVSRGPTRDALTQLRSEGLVESRRGRIYVIGLTPPDVEELYHLRFLIEGEVLRLVANQDNAPADLIDDSLERLEAAYHQGDADVYAAADLQFHTSFYDTLGHRRLSDVWAMYRATFASILKVTNAEDVDLGPSYQDHVDLLEAVRAAKIDTALEVLRGHLDGSKQRFLAAHQRQLDEKR